MLTKQIEEKQVKAIIHSAKSESEALGFIPAEAYTRAAREGRLIAEIEQGEQLAWVLSGARRMRTRIFQAYVRPDVRRQRLAAGMVKHLEDEANQNGVIEHVLHVAVDIEAFAFWQAVGFAVSHEVNRANTRGRRVAEMRRRTTFAQEVDKRMKERLPSYAHEWVAQAAGKLALIKATEAAKLRGQK